MATHMKKDWRCNNKIIWWCTIDHNNMSWNVCRAESPCNCQQTGRQTIGIIEIIEMRGAATIDSENLCCIPVTTDTSSNHSKTSRNNQTMHQSLIQQPRLRLDSFFNSYHLSTRLRQVWLVLPLINQNSTSNVQVFRTHKTHWWPETILQCRQSELDSLDTNPIWHRW